MKQPCQAKITTRYGLGEPCAAFAWAEGFCYRHHPKLKLAVLKVKLLKQQGAILQLQDEITKLETTLSANQTKH